MPCSFCATWKRSGRHGNWAWPGDAEIVGQGDGIDPFDVHLTGLRAGDVDAHAGPRLALVRDAELHVHRTVVQQEWLSLSAEREPLIWLAGQRLLEAVGEVRSRVPEDDVDVLCGAGAVAQTEFERHAALDDEEW